MDKKISTIFILIIFQYILLSIFVLLPNSCKSKLGLFTNITNQFGTTTTYSNSSFVTNIISQSDHIYHEDNEDKNLVLRYNHLLTINPEITMTPELISIDKYGNLDLSQKRDLKILWIDPIDTTTILLQIDANIIPLLTKINTVSKLSGYLTLDFISKLDFDSKISAGLGFGFLIDARVNNKFSINTDINLNIWNNHPTDLQLSFGGKFRIF